MTYTKEQWIELAAVSTRALSKDQIDAIGSACWSKDQAGEQTSVWHEAALLFGSKCNCRACVRS